MSKYNKLIFILLIFCALTGSLLAVDRYIKHMGEKYVVEPETCPQSQAAIVLGAYVSPEGRLCDMLADRVRTAVELYMNNKVKKIIMTGDHGHKGYDEVNYMRIYAEKLGVPTEDIFMDHAGFCTYDSMYRARHIFLVNSAVVVTQAFHLPRAVYTARCLGINAVGVKADKHVYVGADYYYWREVPARLKAFVQLHIAHSRPRFLGEVIPVYGDGRLTHDRFSKDGM